MTTDQTTDLTAAERTMLAYALDQAQEKIWSEDGFTDEDQAAVTSLRRLTAVSPVGQAPATGRMACRTTQHCAYHGWCRRCDPEFAAVMSRVNKAIQRTDVGESHWGPLYEAVAGALRGTAVSSAVRVPAPDQTAKAEALLLYFTAEAHRRKWSYDRGLDDDGAPIKSEAFDALHRLGEEMRVELEKLRAMPAPVLPATGDRTAVLAATLREVLGTFAPMREVHGGPVSYYDGSADIEPEQYERWRAVLADEPAAGSAGRVADDTQPAHSCRNCEGIDPDTCLFNPDRPPEQCPRDEFDGYGRQCQKPAGHNLCTFEEQPPAVGGAQQQEDDRG